MPRKPFNLNIDRRRLLTALGAIGLGGGAAAQTPRDPAQNVPDNGAREYIIRNAYVVTMERDAGDIAAGDIHVRDGAIVAIGSRLPASNSIASLDATGMIAMPGMIDTHWHLWNTTLRNMQRSGTEYFPVKQAFVQHYKPEDHYAANRLSVAEAIDAGITTIANFSNNTRSPAHADAELRAMAEGGIRGRYYYGPPDPTPKDRTCDLDDIKRVKQEWFGSSSRFHGMVDLGIAMRGFRGTTEQVVAAEYAFAKDQGLPTIVHTGATKKLCQSVAKLYKAGYVDRTSILCHWIGQTNEDLDALAKSGATLAFAPTSDMRTFSDASFHDGLFSVRQTGANMSLSLDSALLANVSMFQQMAAVWYFGVPWYDTFTEKLPFFEFTDVLEMGTINGAKALGIADKVGSLKAGKRADIVLVRSTDANMTPLGEVHSALGRAATVANVDTVIIDGRIRKRGGKLTDLNIGDIARDAERSCNALRIQAGGAWAPVR